MLTKYDLYKEDDKWALKRRGAKRATKLYDKKAHATKGGELRRATGNDPASITIRKENGVIQEERTFPRGEDPRSSKG